MKRSILIYMILFSVLPGCKGQSDSKQQTLYYDDFRWRITIPENFVNVHPDASSKLQDKGVQPVENSSGEQGDDEIRTIFVFKNGDFNYLESTYQLFDPAADGSYMASCKDDREIVFETLRTQMEMAEIDSVSTVQVISGLEFQTFTIEVIFPNGTKWRSLIYNRLFGNRNFSVNITYVDEKSGERMLTAWLASVFE